MPISIEEARTLVAQQQVAHKLIAGFYQNILADLGRLAANCGYTFSGWWPTLTDRPCQARTNPTSKWIWDFLPLYASTFEYKMLEEPTKAEPGNSVLIFRLYCDEAFRSEYRTSFIDPVDMESKQGGIELIVYRCLKSDAKSCFELYNGTEWPKPFTDGWQDVGSKNMKAYYQLFPLEYFIVEQDAIQTLLSDLTSKDYVVPEI